MVVIRDETRIYRLAKIGQYASFVGMLTLIGGLIIAFTSVDNAFLYQLLALTAGWLISQVGMYLAQRYLREPRPDQVLDEAVKKVAGNGRFYHYLLPAPHVLLTPDGIIVFVPKFQGGVISADGDKWTQKGVGFRKYFGQEGVGNPSQEAERMISALANFLRKNAPSIEEAPIGALIVFTSKGVNLNVAKSNIPAMHFTKVKGFLKRQRRESPLSLADYEAIRAAFDSQAGHLIEVKGEQAG